MSDPSTNRSPEDWVALYLEGRIPAGEEAAFNAWVQASPENLDLLMQQLDVHGSLKVQFEKASLRATGRIRLARRGRGTHRHESRSWLGAAAVILLGLALVALLWKPDNRVRPTPEPVTRREAARPEPEPPLILPRPEPPPTPKPVDPMPRKEEAPLPAPPPAPIPEPIVPEPAPPKPDRTIVAVAELRDLKGKVLVERLPAKSAQGLSAGEGVVTVGKDAFAVIVFPDGTSVELRGETEVRDLSVEKGKRLFLARGTLDASVMKQPPERPMVIETPQAEAKVLGTTLRLQVDARAESTLLEVDEGKVRLTRTTDQKTLDVAAGSGALAERGTELKAKPLPKTSLAMAFEDAGTAKVQFGKLVAGPKRSGSRGCVAGLEVPDDRLTRVILGDARNGLLRLRDGAVLTFDYWVAEKVDAVDVYVWDKTQQASIGGTSLLSLTKEKWTRVTIPFSDFVSRTGQRLQDGDLITELTIQTGGTNGGGPLFVDNVDVTVVRKK